MRSCRNTLPLPAPNAARVESSGIRPWSSPRDSVATLAQLMRRRMAVAPRRKTRGDSRPRVSSTPLGTIRHSAPPPVEDRTCSVVMDKMPPTSTAALSTVAPGASRPMASRLWLFD